MKVVFLAKYMIGLPHPSSVQVAKCWNVFVLKQARYEGQGTRPRTQNTGRRILGKRQKGRTNDKVTPITLYRSHKLGHGAACRTSVSTSEK